MMNITNSKKEITRKLICGSCGANRLAQEGDFLVCAYCGSRFRVHEKHKKVLDQRAYYLRKAEDALKHGYYSDVKDYAFHMQALDPNDPEAWRFLAYYHAEHLAVDDLIESGNSAIQFWEGSKDGIEDEVYGLFLGAAVNGGRKIPTTTDLGKVTRQITDYRKLLQAVPRTHYEQNKTAADLRESAEQLFREAIRTTKRQIRAANSAYRRKWWQSWGITGVFAAIYIFFRSLVLIAPFSSILCFLISPTDGGFIVGIIVGVIVAIAFTRRCMRV